MSENERMRRGPALTTVLLIALSVAGCARGMPHVEKVEPAPLHAPATELLPPSSATFSPPLWQESDGPAGSGR